MSRPVPECAMRSATERFGRVSLEERQRKSWRSGLDLRKIQFKKLYTAKTGQAQGVGGSGALFMRIIDSSFFDGQYSVVIRFSGSVAAEVKSQNKCLQKVN